MKRDRSKPKYTVLKAAIEAVLSDPEQLSLLATACIENDQPGVWWDEDGPHFEDDADWDAQIKDVETRLRSLLAILTSIPTQKRKAGGQTLPGEPDLTELDRDILKLAHEYSVRTRKAAANGAIGPNISNQGGPFVREAAAKVCDKGEGLEKAVARVIARIDRMEKHPRLKTLWDRARDPTWLEKTYGPALKNLGLTD